MSVSARVYHALIRHSYLSDPHQTLRQCSTINSSNNNKNNKRPLSLVKAATL